MTEPAEPQPELRFESPEALHAYLSTINVPSEAPGDAQLRMLRHAMQDTAPACRDDERFIADHLSARHRYELGKVCGACPLRSPCRAYAMRARPEAGFWAGQMYDQ